MTGQIFGLLCGFWAITIRMFSYLTVEYRGEKSGQKRKWLYAAAAGVPMAALTCCLWQLAAALVIAAGFAAMKKASYGAPLVMAGALALAIVTAVFGNML